MRLTAVWVLCGLTIGCDALAPETSPATLPARVVEAPTLSPSTVDSLVLAAAIRDGVRQRSANEGLYEVDAFLATLVVEDLRSARPSVVLAPVAENGLQIGYRISGIRDGSVYGAVGLLDGDLIESINGVVLAGPDQVAGAIVGSDRVAALQVTRAGVSSVRELRIRPGLAWSTLLAARTGAPPPDLADGTGVIDPPIVAVIEPPPELPLEPPGASPSPRTSPRGSSTPTPNTGKPAPRPSPSNPPASGPASSGIACAGDGSCTIPRREFDAAVADPDRLLRQVQFTEVSGGIRLYGVRAGSQVSALGFRNGDIIKSVNGTGMDDQLGLLGLYAGLGNTSTYNVRVARGGATQTRTIRIR